MNDIEKRKFSAVGSIENNPFVAYAEAQDNRMIVGILLKFNKGTYSAGQDNEKIAVGTQMIANMDELLAGWVRWGDGKPIDYTHMGRIVEGFQPPPRRELGDSDSEQWEDGPNGQPRDPWQFTNLLLLKATSKGGQLYTFSASSKGGLDAVGALCMAYGSVMAQRPDEYPVIELGAGGYDHPNRARGFVDTPKFKVVGWVPKIVFIDDAEAIGKAAAPLAEKKGKSRY